MSATETALRISLELDCERSEQCHELSAPLLEQLFVGYDLCSVLELPTSVEVWLTEHRTARKRVSRCARRGYLWQPLERERYLDDLYEINRSAHVRQGRPMSPGYRARPTYGPLPRFDCERHAIRTTGIWTPDGKLVGYLAMYRCGDLALVSQILGHSDYLDHEIMFLLFAGALTREVGHGPGTVVYNRHDSGTDGLRFYKERLGFEEAEVQWAP